MIGDWLLIAGAVAVLVIAYVGLGKIIDNCIDYWRAWKEEVR
jgi:hypothetical protein